MPVGGGFLVRPGERRRVLMDGFVVGLLVGAVLLGVGMLALRRRRGGGRSARMNVSIQSSIEEMRSVGELSVFKVITKEIVTADKHFFGPQGRKYFNWIVSSKKMALIITFNIDFRYDLQSAEFVISEGGRPGAYRLRMPRCFYETQIVDLSIYDEQRSEFLPALMPDLLSRVFGGDFTEADKNELIEEAKKQASEQARRLVEKMRSEVQNSARQTLSALAKAFGAEHVDFDFDTAELVQFRVDYDARSDGSAKEDSAAAA